MNKYIFSTYYKKYFIQDCVHGAGHPGDGAAAERRAEDQVLPAAQHEGALRAVDPLHLLRPRPRGRNNALRCSFTLLKKIFN